MSRKGVSPSGQKRGAPSTSSGQKRGAPSSSRQPRRVEAVNPVLGALQYQLQYHDDPMWCMAQLQNGNKGLIPVNYVKKASQHSMTDQKTKLANAVWFHGNISRDDAEELLQPREDGLFLIRESTNYPGDYTLCVCHENTVQHYRILFRDSRYTIDEEDSFDTLETLVGHYIKDNDGLCTRLVRPMPKPRPPSKDLSNSQHKDDLKGWSIDRSKLHLGEKLGKGEFGDVMKGEYEGRQVAVKSLKDKTKAADIFLAEASVMASMDHPNLVKLLGVVLGDTIYIVTEFMTKGNLADYLQSRGRAVITKKQQITFARDTCAGMAYLESKKLVHRDLAARNVLLSAECTAKVSDFGLARQANTTDEKEGKLPIKWTAPEALLKNQFTSKSDMWSFGILLWEIYSFGRKPYPRMPMSEVLSHVEKGYRMEAPDGCPKEVYTIMKQAWEQLPQNRPSFAVVLDKLNSLLSLTPNSP